METVQARAAFSAWTARMSWSSFGPTCLRSARREFPSLAEEREFTAAMSVSLNSDLSLQAALRSVVAHKNKTLVIVSEFDTAVAVAPLSSLHWRNLLMRRSWTIGFALIGAASTLLCLVSPALAVE